MTEAAGGLQPEVIAGIESRGFIFGLPVRKAGKLPHDVATAHYDLEYGTATLAMHRTPSVAGLRVVVVDDLLATGGTASAAARLVEELGGTVVGFVFLIGLDALDGQAALGSREVRSILAY